jgi:hypothetical protein
LGLFYIFSTILSSILENNAWLWRVKILRRFMVSYTKYLSDLRVLKLVEEEWSVEKGRRRREIKDGFTLRFLLIKFLVILVVVWFYHVDCRNFIHVYLGDDVLDYVTLWLAYWL